MKAKVKLKVYGLLKDGQMVNPAGEPISENKKPLIMSGEGGLTTETELVGSLEVTGDQVADIVKKTWGGMGILVLMELDE